MTIREAIAVAYAARQEELSISELARLADVSRAKVSRYLAGDADVTTETADRLMRALGVTVVAPKSERARA